MSVALQELEPKAALQQIALPADSDQRAAGIAALSHLVWTADKSRLGMERAEFMRAVRANLTAAEQVRWREFLVFVLWLSLHLVHRGDLLFGPSEACHSYTKVLVRAFMAVLE